MGFFFGVAAASLAIELTHRNPLEYFMQIYDRLFEVLVDLKIFSNPQFKQLVARSFGFLLNLLIP
jgi:hypothetical protein